MKVLCAMVLVLLLAVSMNAALAADIPFEITLGRDTVEVGDTVALGLVFNNTQGIPAQQLPEIAGFKSQYVGPSTIMSVVNGVTSSMVTHRYKLVAVQKGEFAIGPFSFSIGGKLYTAPAKAITVVDRGQFSRQPGTSPAPTAGNALPETDLNGNIFLILSAGKVRGYVNERVPVTVKLYVKQLAVRYEQSPVLEGQGYVSEGFKQSRQYRETLGGAVHDVVEFQTAVFPTKEGQITLGPATLKCSIIARNERRRNGSGLNDFFENDLFDDSFLNDFFGRVKVYPLDVKSPELLLSVAPFPEAGKPREFSGTVGQFQMDLTSAPAEVKAGDPVTLTMKISGVGNFDSVQSPVLSSSDGFKVYTAEARDTAEGKIFEQVIIPLSEKVTEIPAIIFAFFDPVSGEYVRRRQGPVPLRVMPSPEKTARIVDAATPGGPALPAATRILGKDIVYIREDVGAAKRKGEFLYQNRLFNSGQVLPALFFLTVYGIQRRRQRLASDVRYARKLRAPKIARVKLKIAREYLQHNKTAEFYNHIFKTMQEYLGHRFNMPSAGITASITEELIARQGLSREAGEKLKMCFADCDNARYAAGAFDQRKMRQTLAAIEEIIDYLERKKQ